MQHVLIYFVHTVISITAYLLTGYYLEIKYT